MICRMYIKSTVKQQSRLLPKSIWIKYTVAEKQAHNPSEFSRKVQTQANLFYLQRFREFQ